MGNGSRVVKIKGKIMTLFQLLQTLGKPVAYGYHSNPQPLPYFCIMGAGQGQFEADNTYYTRKDHWQIEYYFTSKDPTFEATIENLLLNNGYKYSKSEDVYIENEDVFVIYYDI